MNESQGLSLTAKELLVKSALTLLVIPMIIVLGIVSHSTVPGKIATGTKTAVVNVVHVSDAHLKNLFEHFKHFPAKENVESIQHKITAPIK